jgi:hypothetical protein
MLKIRHLLPGVGHRARRRIVLTAVAAVLILALFWVNA